MNGKTCRLNDSEFMFTSNGNNLFSMELDGFAIQLDDGAVSRVTDGGNSRNIRNVSINGDGVKRFANIVDGLNNRNHKIARRDVSGLKNSTNHIQAAAKRALKFKLVTKSNPNLLTNVTMNPNNMIIFAGKTTAENRYLRFKSGKSRSSRETGGGRSSFQVVSTYPRSTEEYNSAYYFDLIPSKKSGQRIIQSARAIQDLGSNSTIKMRMIAFGPRGYITVDGRTSNLAVTTDGDNGAKNTALLWTRTKNPKKRGMMQLGLGSLGVFQFDGDHNSIQYHNATSNDEATLWKQIIRSYNDPSKGPIDVVQLSPLRSAAPKCIYLTSEDGFHLDKCDLEDESDRKFSYIEMIG